MAQLSDIITNTGDRLVGVEDVAGILGIKVSSLRVHSARSTARRSSGNTIAGNLPEPNYKYGRSPVWLESEIIKWAKTRKEK